MSSAVVFGASGGIGQALVAALVETGTYARIFALSRSQASQPESVQSLSVDITDEASIAAAAEAVGAAGPVGLVLVASGLLHGAGIAPEKAIRA
ncbi:KR domain-containing protein, partial [Escherichia coli]|nr:KR domain-containing protein [Escherichia coli]